MDKKSIIITIIVTVISCVGFFVSGYFLYPLLRSEEKVILAEPTNDPVIPDDTTVYLPGKHYFDDTAILISKDDPNYTLVATVNRSENEDLTFLQNTRISFFDGEKWSRSINQDNNPDSSIKNNKLINNWSIDYDKSRVLKQNVIGELNLNGKQVGFDTKTIENEISVRSLPGYTKFMSEGDGILTINGVSHEAYVLYTRIYSSNSSELFTYDGDLELLTDWIAFWDNDGNFYHVDSTEVKNPVPNYQTHSIGIIKNKVGSVTKIFKLNIDRDEVKPPTKYTVNLGYPISKNLTFEKYNDINKAPNNSYIWHMGNIKNENGIGLIEYIFK